jgi:hypothetical protein
MPEERTDRNSEREVATRGLRQDLEVSALQVEGSNNLPPDHDATNYIAAYHVNR